MMSTAIVDEFIEMCKFVMVNFWFHIIVIIVIISFIYAIKKVFFTPCEGCMNGGHGIPISPEQARQKYDSLSPEDKAKYDELAKRLKVEVNKRNAQNETNSWTHKIADFFQDLNLETVGNKLPADTQGLAMSGTPGLDAQVTSLPLSDSQPVNLPTITVPETTTTTTIPETTTSTTTTTIPETTTSTTTTEPETTTPTTTVPTVTIQYVNLAKLENNKESKSAAM